LRMYLPFMLASLPMLNPLVNFVPSCHDMDA
jgi:hypothetical protein